MAAILWLIPALPLAGFVLLALAGGRLSRTAVVSIGVGSVGLATVVACIVSGAFLLRPPVEGAYTQALWTWIDVGGFTPGITLYFDALALVMTLVVAFVSFLIHGYSVEFMTDEEGYSRFFACMNLFVASMLTLVLAQDLLLLYLGWEGVGLCSYLLIGFWYTDPANGAAARKAFIVTRVGDTAMAIGLFLLFTHLGTLDIPELMRRAAHEWPESSTLAVAAAALLLGGALGKSAQLPLQTWLPDAMAGPTPVSALIHAATMVTAGVYLIARTNVLFRLAPAVQMTVAVIGAATLLVAGFSALVQRDIKRVLAYSTISQIGYMFLALGVGAWSAAIFHFMTHAFFKALLFLAAGVVILAMDHEHDMLKMGGLRRQLPVTFWTFLIGAASLASLPLVTAGFYSKDLILAEAWQSARGSPWLWAAGWVGAWLTAIYSFRMVFLTFFGTAKRPIHRRPSLAMQVPLLILAVLSIGAGLIDLHRPLGNWPLFSEFLQNVLPAPPGPEAGWTSAIVLTLAAALASVLGIYIAYVFFLQVPRWAEELARTGWGSLLHRFWFTGWGFDWLYDRLLVWPYWRLAQWDKDDFFDRVFTGVARLSEACHAALRRTQTGRVRWYASGLAVGAVVGLLIVVLLWP